MKQFKKQILLVLCMAVCLLALTACSKAEEAPSVDPSESASLQANTQAILENVLSIEDYEIDKVIKQYRENDMEALASSMEGYANVKNDLGAYQSTNSGTVEKTDSGYTITLNAVFEKRECAFTLSLNMRTGEITSFSFDPVYTMSENMTKAGLNTLMGMGTVFSVLIFISWLISCFRYIGKYEEQMKKKHAPAPTPVRTRPAARSYSPAPAVEENLTDDLELVAVITAAIAASTGACADGLVVRSIRRAPDNQWKRA